MAYTRPPWVEPAVPTTDWGAPLFEDVEVTVLDKPAGLPCGSHIPLPHSPTSQRTLPTRNF